jgi:hypothetical protein
MSFFEPSIKDRVFVATSIQPVKCDIVDSLTLVVSRTKAMEANHVASISRPDLNLLVVDVVVIWHPLADYIFVQAH